MPRTDGSIATANTLDSVEYDLISNLNIIFSHSSILPRAPAVLEALKSNYDVVDQNISNLVAAQTTANADSIQRIHTAKAELAALFQKIESVRGRALQTEQAITNMTADIKKLDSTKRNLTLSMTALKRLQMLTTAYEQLRSLGKSRQYKECAQLLQAVIQLMTYFKSYRSIAQIATLGRNVSDLQQELLEQVSEDFEDAFAKGEIFQKRNTLSEACLVLDALGENARSRLITWYCNASLKEYKQVYRSIDEAGSLDNISRRYAWFNRMMKTYDVEHSVVFPPYWNVNEMLANSFCETTRDDFKSILQRSARRSDGQTVDVNLLLSCLQETLDFEHGLQKRFNTGSRMSLDTPAYGDDKPRAFEQSISEAFEPYLSLWVDVQDRQMAALIPKYRQQPLRNAEEEFSPQGVIPSSTELISFYRLTLAQCAKLSTGKQLLELTKIFAKYLDQYNQQILVFSLGDRSGPQGPSVEDLIMILNTADYCYLTVTQLEDKIKARIDDEFKPAVDLQYQADAFMGILGAAIRALVRKVELDCESGWREMRNTAWSKLENTGDQSSYVGVLLQYIKSRVSEVLKLLHKQQYARVFCDNLVDALTNTYMANIVQCRPISEVAAEQMLLDFYVLKKAFTDLPLLNAEGSRTSQAAYAKRVTQTTAKIDPLLKTLQVRPNPPEGLVQAYLIHIADSSDINFRKILELKGLSRKQDQAQLMELFHAHCASHSQNLSSGSTTLTSLQLQGPNQFSGGAASISSPFGQVGTAISAPNLAGAAGFGSAILSAARDGVDRLGSPIMTGGAGAATHPVAGASASLIASAAPSRIVSPVPGEQFGPVNLNDNLGGIGRFFKRDMSGFGRFGGNKSNDDGNLQTHE